MGWSSFTLSTLASLTNHEAEINNLVNRYTRKAIKATTATTITATPDTLTTLAAIDSAYNQTSLIKGTGTWALPAGTYIRMIGDADYFSCLEGSGTTLFGVDGTYSLALIDNDTEWVDVEFQSTWQSKIDVAKQFIYDKIFSGLSSKATPDIIPAIIDSIENEEALNLCSDFKSLELIFIDLFGKVGTAETINAKINYYRQAFNDAFLEAFSALDFGTYGYLFHNQMGRVSR